MHWILSKTSHIFVVINDIVLVSLLLTLNMFHTFFWRLYCWLWKVHACWKNVYNNPNFNFMSVQTKLTKALFLNSRLCWNFKIFSFPKGFKLKEREFTFSPVKIIYSRQEAPLKTFTCMTFICGIYRCNLVITLPTCVLWTFQK